MNLELKKHKRATIALGTIVEITVWVLPEQEVNTIFKAAYNAINVVHAKMSVHDDASDLGRYRLAANHESVVMSAETIKVLRFCETLFWQSQGYFDVCIGNNLAKNAYLPPEFFKDVQFQPRNQPLEIEQTHIAGNGVVKKIPNNFIDLGGVAKGFAVDYAIETLQSLNVPSAIVNAGGDLRIYGEIAAPIHIRKNHAYTFYKALQNRAFASSGMPSNHEIAKDTLPIVNPLSGNCLEPSDGVISIEADQAMVADALTKLAWLNVLNEPILNQYNAQFITEI